MSPSRGIFGVTQLSLSAESGRGSGGFIRKKNWGNTGRHHHSWSDIQGSADRAADMIRVNSISENPQQWDKERGKEKTRAKDVYIAQA
jgi:hypothetical protein